MKRMPRSLRNQRGIAFVAGIFVATAVVGVAGLGVGLGHLYTVFSEAQNAADAGALAGVEAMFDGDSVDLGAKAAMALNFLTGGADGQGSGAVADANIISILTGNYDPDTGFQSGVPPENAVEVITTTDVVGYIRGGASSNVSARSVAALLGRESITPSLPVVIGACRLPSDCFDDSCMPLLNGVAASLPQTTFTSLFLAANAVNVRTLLPTGASCPQAYCQPGDAAEGVTINVGDHIGIYKPNSADVKTLRCIKQCLFDAGVTSVEVPVVGCELQNGGTAEVLGFAAFEIESVNPTSPNQGLALQGKVLNPGETGGGGQFFGVGVITLVE